MASTEAYVLPHLVEVATASEGVVSRVFVREGDLVSRGQDLLEIRRPTPCGPAVIIRSSAHGVVSRCRVRVGDAVARARPVLSIIGDEDVLVVARFDASVGASLRRGMAASVRIPRATAAAVQATILHVDGGPGDSGPPRDGNAGVRVVARLESAPPAALWAGIDAVLHVQRDDRA